MAAVNSLIYLIPIKVVEKLCLTARTHMEALISRSKHFGHS
jgi:hypothetical protein